MHLEAQTGDALDFSLRTGVDPRTVSTPKRFLAVESWRGKIDGAYLEALKDAYAGAILDLAGDQGEPGH